MTDDLHFVLLPRRTHLAWWGLALGPALPAMWEAAWRGDGADVTTGRDVGANGGGFGWTSAFGGGWRLVGAAMCAFLLFYEVRRCPPPPIAALHRQL